MQLLWYMCFIAVLVSVMAAKQPGRARGGRNRDRDRPPGNRGRRPQDSDEVAGQRPSLGEGGRRGRGRGGELPEFVRMIRGRYDNSESLLEVEGVDQEGPGLPRITMSFTPVEINSLRPQVTGILIQANMGSAPPMINLMTYEPVKQKRGESFIRTRAWGFRNPGRFINGWENPAIFLDLDPSDVANEELVPWFNCTHQYRRTENGTFVSNGTGENCKAPSPHPPQSYQMIRETVVTGDSYTLETTVHAADGQELMRVRFTLDKVEDPARPLNMTSIMDALMSGASANYRLDLTRCEVTGGVDGETPALHHIGGQVREFQYVPAGRYGPVGYLRTVGHTLIVKGDSRVMRMTAIRVMESDGVVILKLREQPLGVQQPAPSTEFRCNLNSGPRGLPVFSLRQPHHLRQLYGFNLVLMALNAGHPVRMTVDLSLCRRGDNGTDIVTLAATEITDFDAVVSDGEGIDLNFNSMTISESVCSAGPMAGGASVTLHQATNTATVHQWALVFPRWNACFNVAYECGISSRTTKEGTTFYMM